MQPLSLAYSFALAMIKENADKEIGLVMNSKGGIKIVEWLPGIELYNDTIKQTHKVLKYGKLKGVIWHQGEGDWHPLLVDMYLGRLEMLWHSR
jgi:hypothetical protein